MLLLGQIRVTRDQSERLLPCLLDHGAVANEIGDPELWESGLPGTEEFPRPSYREVDLCDLEPVVGPRRRLDAAPGIGRRHGVEQDAVALERPAANATSKLMELRETEALSVLDQHDGRVGHIDADLDHGRRHEDVNVTRLEFAHDAILLLEAHPTVQQADPQIGEDLCL